MGQVLFKFNLIYAILIIFGVSHSMRMSRLVIHVMMPTFKRLLMLGQIQYFIVLLAKHAWCIYMLIQLLRAVILIIYDSVVLTLLLLFRATFILMVHTILITICKCMIHMVLVLFNLLFKFATHKITL